jgi:branched-subunit amino acid aminotransferase/4-amino-4-deoxychorismate lyase
LASCATTPSSAPSRPTRRAATTSEAREATGSPGGATGDELVCLNGELVAERAALVPVVDRAVTHGIGLYETLKLVDGVPVFFDQHMDRLQAGLDLLQIQCPWDRVTIAGWIVALTGEAGVRDGGCRVLVTGGPEWGRPSVLIRNDVRPYPARPLRVISYRGIRVSGALKAMTFMQSHLAQRAAATAGADDAVFVDDEGRMFEGATSNVFVARGGGLVTAPAEGDILPGVLRATLERVATADGIPVVEAFARINDLRRDDGMFLTSSVRGIVPVARLDDRELRVDDELLGRLRRLVGEAERASAAAFRASYL